MHIRFFYLTIFVIIICLPACKNGEKEVFVLSAPAGSSYVQIDKNGKTVIPNVPESFSVWTINLENPVVTAKTKTGNLVGEMIEGIPAVGVIDIPDMQVIGHKPAGWFPSKLEVSPDGKKLVVANAKGFGSGPNGGADYKVGPEGSYIGSLMKGTVSVFEIPSDEELESFTQTVIPGNTLSESVRRRRYRPGRFVCGSTGFYPIQCTSGRCSHFRSANGFGSIR